MTNSNKEERAIKKDLVNDNKLFFENLTNLMDSYSDSEAPYRFAMPEINSTTKLDSNYITMTSIRNVDIEIKIEPYKMDIKLTNGKPQIKISNQESEVASWEGELESIRTFFNKGNLQIKDKENLLLAMDIFNPILKKYNVETMNIPNSKANKFSKSFHGLTSYFSNTPTDDIDLNTLPSEITLNETEKKFTELHVTVDDYNVRLSLFPKGTFAEVTKNGEIVASFSDQREQSSVLDFSDPSSFNVYDNKVFKECMPLIKKVMDEYKPNKDNSNKQKKSIRNKYKQKF